MKPDVRTRRVRRCCRRSEAGSSGFSAVSTGSGVLVSGIENEGPAQNGALEDWDDDIAEAADDGGEAGQTIAFSPEDAAARGRIDAVLAAHLSQTMGADAPSRARIQALIRAGQVTLDGRTIGEPGRRVNAGAQIVLTLPPPEPAEPAAENIPLDIVYEDEAVIVVDKPAGLVVHPAAGHAGGTLVNALLHHCGASLSGIGGVLRPGIVHRLDKDTSGLMVVAKSDRAHKSLAAQFADHGRTGALERAYIALVWGGPRAGGGTIDAPLGRSPQNRQRQAVVRSGGREAITHFEVLERYGRTDGDTSLASLVECRLETGRTHQIRVHMAHIGYPLVGDEDYGAGFRTKVNRLPEPAQSAARSFPRQALHAALIAFEHPLTGEVMRFKSEPPEDLAGLIEAFRAIGD